MDNSFLEEFVKCYVNYSFETIESFHLMKLEDFDSTILRKVSEKTGLSREKVRYLHHAFHWALFIDKKHPFELINPEGYLAGYQIKKNGKIPVREEIYNKIINDYGLLLNSKINSKEWEKLP